MDSTPTVVSALSATTLSMDASHATIILSAVNVGHLITLQATQLVPFAKLNAKPAKTMCVHHVNPDISSMLHKLIVYSVSHTLRGARFALPTTLARAAMKAIISLLQVLAQTVRQTCLAAFLAPTLPSALFAKMSIT